LGITYGSPLVKYKLSGVACGWIKPTLNAEVVRSEVKRRVVGDAKVIPTPIKVAAATDRASAVGRGGVKGREGLDGGGAANRKRMCARTCVNKAVALTT